jgi:predicted metal-binding protein
VAHERFFQSGIWHMSVSLTLSDFPAAIPTIHKGGDFLKKRHLYIVSMLLAILLVTGNISSLVLAGEPKASTAPVTSETLTEQNAETTTAAVPSETIAGLAAAVNTAVKETQAARQEETTAAALQAAAVITTEPEVASQTTAAVTPAETKTEIPTKPADGAPSSSAEAPKEAAPETTAAETSAQAAPETTVAETSAQAAPETTAAETSAQAAPETSTAAAETAVETESAAETGNETTAETAGAEAEDVPETNAEETIAEETAAEETETLLSAASLHSAVLMKAAAITSVNHIDIGVSATATISVNGQTVSRSITLTSSDFTSKNVEISAVQNGSSVSYTANFRTISTSTGSSGVRQYRVSGTYPVGTPSNPVEYTFKLTKDIAFTVNGQSLTLPITFQSVFTYFDDDNDCPGLSRDYQSGNVSRNSGMDFVLGAGSGTTNYISVQKNVIDEETGEYLPVSGYSSTFAILVDGTPSQALTVNVGSGGIGQGMAEVGAGAVTITESAPAGSISANGTEYVYSKTTIGAGSGDVSEGLTSGSSLSSGGTFTVNNYYRRAVTSVSVSKEWDDGGNQDGMRPDGVSIQMYRNGEKSGGAVTLSAVNGWSYRWEGLDKYSGGEEIAWTVGETDVPTGYTSSVSGTMASGFIVRNTHTPETTSVSGIKTWNDSGNQDGMRPADIVVNLLADDEPVSSQTVSASDNWSYTFSGLPVYKNGRKIVYEVTEDAVNNYATTINGFDITNTYTPKETSLTVVKAWEDKDNQDGKRPESVSVQLYKDGTAYGTAVTLNAGNTWTYIWNELPMYRDGGTRVAYTVEEVSKLPDGYTSEVNGSAAAGYIIKNSYTPETTTISGSKVWDDGGDQDGMRPESITVKLLADGSVAASQTVTAASQWTYTFVDVPVYKNGKKIVYTVTENPVEGYKTSVDGYNITNTHTPETTQITVSKTWNDSGNQDGMRPESITVKLLADGSVAASQTVTAASQWTYTFADLPVYDNGEKIIYTVTEEAVANYATTISGFDITNTYTPEKTSLTVTKKWDDGNNQDGLRPDAVRVQLYKDGVAEGRAVTLDAAGKWAYTWTGLDMYRDGGTEVIYTVAEVSKLPEGYQASVSGSAEAGYIITNSYTPQTTSLMVTKKWDDGENKDGLRTDSIIVHILKNGEDTGIRLMLDAKDGWTAALDNLPVYADGEKITYTVFEESVEGYTAAVSGSMQTGFTITNTHEPAGTDTDTRKTDEDPVTEPTEAPPASPAEEPEVRPAPQTGINSHLPLYLLLLMASLAALAGLGASRRKHEE